MFKKNSPKSKDSSKRGSAKENRPFKRDGDAPFKKGARDFKAKNSKMSDNFDKTRNEHGNNDAKARGPKRELGGAKRFEDRASGSERGSYTDRSSSRPEQNDRPKRTYNRSDAGSRDATDRPKRTYNRTDAGSRDATDRPKRTYNRTDAGSRDATDRPKRTYNRTDAGSRDATDRPKRTYNRTDAGSRDATDRPKRTYNRTDAGSRDATDRPKRGYNKKETTGRYGDEREEKRSYRSRDENKSEYQDRPKRTVDSAEGKKRASRAPKDNKIRLNKFLSNAGIASRRKADELIIAGEVSVNGKTITELGYKVDPDDDIRFNGSLIRKEKPVYVLLNKPKDYITTTEDPLERKTVMHLVAKLTRDRVYPVGRLDRNTTGLLLLTNDGALAQKLSHPKSAIRKLYSVTLDKNLTHEHFKQILEEGVELEDGSQKVDDLAYVDGATKKEIGIELHSGKNRVVRRIFEQLGYKVQKLDRVIYASLNKKNLPRGECRFLTQEEITILKTY